MATIETKRMEEYSRDPMASLKRKGKIVTVANENSSSIGPYSVSNHLNEFFCKRNKIDFESEYLPEEKYESGGEASEQIRSHDRKKYLIYIFLDASILEHLGEWIGELKISRADYILTALPELSDHLIRNNVLMSILDKEIPYIPLSEDLIAVGANSYGGSLVSHLLYPNSASDLDYYIVEKYFKNQKLTEKILGMLKVEEVRRIFMIGKDFQEAIEEELTFPILSEIFSKSVRDRQKVIGGPLRELCDFLLRLDFKNIEKTRSKEVGDEIKAPSTI